MRIFLILCVVMCATPREEGCRIFCAFEGFDGGTYKKEKCVCFQTFDYDLIGLKRTGKAFVRKEEN